jgi:hypothetical protein
LTTIPTRIWDRVYSDFLMPSRLGSYQGLLESALAAGYEIVPVKRFWELIAADAVDPGRRYLILRHDIDTGPRTARQMWQIEHALGIQSSYFFRLSTLDLGLMAEIAAAGSEVSYHFEELATVAKRRHLRTRDLVIAHMTEAQDLFARNIADLRARTGQPMTVVAAHGDFVNRRHDLMNWEILVDLQFRVKVGIELETYDDAFMSHVTSRHADLTSPPFWTPIGPLGAIEGGEPVVYILVHPRGWQVERLFNARDDIVRLSEGLAYALPFRPDTK